MKHVAHVALGGLLGTVLATGPGCFYVEEINQRPSLDIRRNGEGNVQRGSTLSLFAKQDDPEGHDVTYQWTARACGEAGCDDTAFTSGGLDTFDFVVPAYLADGRTAVRSIVVDLNGIDELGALARPAQQDTFEVVNGSPLLTIEERSGYDFVEGTPIDLFARYSDPDDDIDLVTLAWTAFSPTQATPALVDLAVEPNANPLERDVAKRIEKADVVVGEWMVRVVASDELGPPTEKLIMFQVNADGPPCLAQWSPLAPTSPTAYLPIAEPTIFQVPVVRDDLDSYPGNPDRGPEDILGQATFRWSVKAPGAGAFQPVASTHQLAIDPQQYTPGARFEVRVEIFDRTNKPVTCAADDQTCALDVANEPDCIQRQTWRVEAR